MHFIFGKCIKKQCSMLSICSSFGKSHMLIFSILQKYSWYICNNFCINFIKNNLRNVGIKSTYKTTLFISYLIQEIHFANFWNKFHHNPFREMQNEIPSFAWKHLQQLVWYVGIFVSYLLCCLEMLKFQFPWQIRFCENFI